MRTVFLPSVCVLVAATRCQYQGVRWSVSKPHVWGMGIQLTPSGIPTPCSLVYPPPLVHFPSSGIPAPALWYTHPTLWCTHPFWYTTCPLVYAPPLAYPPPVHTHSSNSGRGLAPGIPPLPPEGIWDQT